MDDRCLLPAPSAIVTISCVQVPPLAPGASQVAITRNPADVAGCKAVGNIDGKDIELALDVPVAPQMQNQAIGLGGNRVLDTTVRAPPTGVVYNCPDFTKP